MRASLGSGLVWSLLVLAGCDGGDKDSALLGRWQAVVGDDFVLQFLDDGRLIGAENGRQVFGSYSIPSAGQLLAVMEGDTTLFDYRLQNDTLDLQPVGGSEFLRAIRIRNQ
jgi:hypothetical protein